MMQTTQRAAVAAAIALLLSAGCASNRSADGASGKPAGASTPASTTGSTGDAAKMPAPSRPGAKVVRSRDGSSTGEIVGTPAPGSKFAQLQIGMDMSEVQNLFNRAPDRFHTYESGKRWIPFYFGSDARRLQALYKSEGCLTFTHGNVWGGAGGELILIEVDPSGACYQP